MALVKPLGGDSQQLLAGFGDGLGQFSVGQQSSLQQFSEVNKILVARVGTQGLVR